MRDTDADWGVIGATFPFWGVLAAPEYRQTDLSPDVLAGFYASGRDHMAGVANRLERVTGGPLAVGRALDFGCGVGRLTEAMAAYADATIGVDVSAGMLEQARRNGGGRAEYAEELPDEPLDWINSYIVFQHIPAARGLVLLDRLLDRLAPGGLISLHFTIYREPHLVRTLPPGALSSAPSRRALPWRRRAAPPPVDVAHEGDATALDPLGAMNMYDYGMGDILAVLHRHGILEVDLVHTDHGGHHGEMIFGRRAA